MKLSKQCDEMYAIATYKPLNILLALFVISSIIGIPLMLYFMHSVARNPLHHFNTKVLLIAYGISIIIHLGDRVIYHSWDLYDYWVTMYKYSPCHILSTAQRCFFIRLFFNFGMWFSISTIFSISLERLIATRKSTTYQHDRKWGFIILFIQSLMTIILLIFMYWGTKREGYREYCIAANPQASSFSFFSLALATFLQIFAVLIYRYLLSVNQKSKISPDSLTLNSRYHIRETLRSLENLWLPSKIFLFVQLYFSCGSFILLYHSRYITGPKFIFLIESFILLPQYSIAFPLLVIYLDRKQSKAVMRFF
ncbi:unnamed protein product [Caenorhabditis bovis]|uniref:Uncharacterized protein n=1 Tax=Caenorhabditis bovis TaxID=2654633 RepID=A0A8S1F306_9PELO|nr:unnamed protein product [Caenorhabditis bovis]